MSKKTNKYLPENHCPGFIHFGGVIRYETFYGENFETEFSFMLKEKLWSDTRNGQPRKLSRSTFKVRSYEQVK